MTESDFAATRRLHAAIESDAHLKGIETCIAIVEARLRQLHEAREERLREIKEMTRAVRSKEMTK